MAKYKLEWDEDYDFDLIGICSNHAEYRLTWALNKLLGIELQKEEDYIVGHKKDGDYRFSFYSYYDQETHVSYYLLRNVSDTFKRLIPEKDQIDFFLILKDNVEIEPSDVVESIKPSETVQTAFVFNVEELKSKDNLVF